jgi:hypothetical protein
MKDLFSGKQEGNTGDIKKSTRGAEVSKAMY